MMINSEIHRLALQHRMLDMLANYRPTVTAETALNWLHSAMTFALCEPLDNQSIDQAAATIWVALEEKELLPPWD